MKQKKTILKPVNADLETTKMLVEIFGYKIVKYINITLNGGDKKDDDK